MYKTNQTNSLVSWLLRIGLAGVYVFAGIDSIREPDAWLPFLPPPFIHYLPSFWLLIGFSVFQLVIALALLWRRSTSYAAIISTITLIAIILTNLSSLLVTFRDIGLVFMSAALVVLDWNQRINLGRKS